MNKKKIICWDFDETLGDFYKVSQEVLHNIYSLKGLPIPRDNMPAKKIGLRYGIKDVLKNLSEQGHKHVITTSLEVEEVIKSSLKRTGLTDEFSGIYLRDKTRKFSGRGKSYEDVAKTNRLTSEEAYDNMIAIGDSYADQPIDLEKLVFIYDERAYLSDAKIIQEIMGKINEADNKSFYQAFETLYNSNGNADERFKELNVLIGRDLDANKKSPYNIIQLNDNLAISMGYSLQKNRGFCSLEPGDERNKEVRKSFYSPIIKVLTTKELKRPMEEFN